MNRSNLTTLCYIEKEDAYLMLHRISKKNDVNKDKWIGIGGHFEENESPEECLLREVYEETGLKLRDWHFRGLVTFVSDSAPTEYMHLFTSDDFEGTLTEPDGSMKKCNEGVLAWVDKGDLEGLNLWQGDYIFLRLLNEGCPFFSLKLRYEGEQLAEAVLNGSLQII